MRTLAVVLLLAAGAGGCATSPEARAWKTICARTPVEAGHEYTPEEIRAMNTVHGWNISVEEVNARCR